tara:strand:+ start:4683 stop:5771 length:1089 start_codon:yes stop_codon:yes gene_type:complete
MAITPPEASVVESLIDQHWLNQTDSHRPHLGGSQIGKECERALWYSFRWAFNSSFPGRIRRLFRRGHHEENWFVDDLKSIGVQVLERDPVTGKQFLYSDVGGHVGGSADGLGMNVPKMEDTPHILEFKTHAEKSFLDMKKKGVALSKPVHYAQIQLYMHWQNFKVGLYVSVNKNNDELYSERVHYDSNYSEGLIDKARRVVTSPSPLARMSNDPSFFECKWCDYWETCHNRKATLANCRTCISSTPELDGDQRWSCDHHKIDIDHNQQEQGCPDHRYIPDLLPFAEVIGGDMETRTVDYKVIATDAKFSNSGKGENIYTSKELAVIDPNMIADPGIEAMRETFDGTIVTVSSNDFADEDFPF